MGQQAVVKSVVYVNEVLFEHTTSNCLGIIYGSFHTVTVELGGCD